MKYDASITFSFMVNINHLFLPGCRVESTCVILPKVIEFLCCVKYTAYEAINIYFRNQTTRSNWTRPKKKTICAKFV